MTRQHVSFNIFPTSDTYKKTQHLSISLALLKENLLSRGRFWLLQSREMSLTLMQQRTLRPSQQHHANKPSPCNILLVGKTVVECPVLHPCSRCKSIGHLVDRTPPAKLARVPDLTQTGKVRMLPMAESTVSFEPKAQK